MGARNVTSQDGRRAAIDAGAAAAGLVVFSACFHQAGAWRFAALCGLTTAAIAMGLSLRQAGQPGRILGCVVPASRPALWCTVGIGLGLLFGGAHRFSLGLSPFPGGLRTFAAVAGLVGATEELIFRGWLQGRLARFGWVTAIAAAAAAHAAYKTALFVWPAVPTGVDLASLRTWTLAGGLVLGLLRQYTRSIYPALLAHAAFDLVTYGDLTQAPWWVWD